MADFNCSSALLKNFPSHDYFTKVEFHKEAKKFLRGLAKNGLGLDKSQYEIRSNMGGDAVLGEVILHTDNLYIMAMQNFFSNKVQLLYRSCNGRKDYSGGPNNYVDISYLYYSVGRQKFLTALKHLGSN